MLFAQAFPLAPLFSILGNFLELRSTMNGLAFYSKRFVALPASGIGNWLNIGEILSLVSVAVNCAIIFYTSHVLDSIIVNGAENSDLYKFSTVVLIEHIIMVFKFALQAIIKDKPGWVEREEREIMEGQTEIFAMLETRKHKYRQPPHQLPLED